MPKNAAPLTGVRVLDLTRILAGPWATQNLADLGAEVIKIEHPNGGDDTRQMGPPFVRDQHTGEIGDAAYFLAANRGKKSVAIDIAKPEGQKLVRGLAASCDVLVENFKVGGLARYGLDYASLRTELPRLVYCSITGFGQTGPYRQRAGYDYLIQGMGGLMSVTGEPDDKPGGGPQRAGVALADVMSGMYAALGILAALRHRDATGAGQHLDIGMLDVQVAVLVNQSMNFLTTGTPPQRMGNGHPNIVPYQYFPATDGQFILAVGNDAQFRRAMQVLGLGVEGADLRFATIALRVANREALLALMTERTRTRSVDDWVNAMEAVDVPCGPINTIDRVFADPQVKARGMQMSLAHECAGEVPSVANPMRFSETPIRYQSGPPLLGQHTREVLRDVLGASDADITTWIGQGLVKETP
ncbi:CaiB/BaiF CoA-transferase family protein [Ramlibacter sp.]|uniref:CaiB/BaiF CoA transferase family protein n=1 Tax=Ramlibacter sp. TaxID=1917967 RepID=UPI0026135FA0|nr:CaiB/BaiF CoA-transferase family protein [Ramlibacter sp.]